MKTTDTTKTTVAIHQTINKTEILQTNNHVEIVTEQITNTEIVKFVSNAEEWDTSLAHAEHHDSIRTMGNKIRTPTKFIGSIKITTRTAILHSNKMLYINQSTCQRQHVVNTNKAPLTQLP